MPKNVKNFDSLLINNYDESVITFLQKFERNTLSHNVNLYFHDCRDFLMQIMTLALFTNINMIGINNPDVLDQLQNEYSELAVPMLRSARVLIADYNCRDFWFCDWLHIPSEDGKPKFLFLCGNNLDGRSFSLSQFLKHIKKGNQAVSFIIKLGKFRDEDSVQSLILENGQTREKLVIKEKTPAGLEFEYVSILRYPMGTNEEKWIEKMSQRPNIHNRAIKFDDC